jgi:hypothetical protein
VAAAVVVVVSALHRPPRLCGETFRESGQVTPIWCGGQP